MKRMLLVLILLATTSSPSHAEDFWRESGRACFFGASVLGVSAAMVLYPAVASGATVPATTLVIGNAIFGCGLAMIGTMASYGFGALYDRINPSEPVPNSPMVPQKSRDSVT